ANTNFQSPLGAICNESRRTLTLKSPSSHGTRTGRNHGTTRAKSRTHLPRNAHGRHVQCLFRRPPAVGPKYFPDSREGSRALPLVFCPLFSVLSYLFILFSAEEKQL